MIKADSPWNPFGQPPEFGQDDVGGAFLDMLFGLVVAKIFLDATGSHSAPRIAHLALAGTVTTTSWIGYRQSQGRSPFKLKYFNLPMVQFLTHLALVLVFFLLAESAEQPGPSTEPSALPESFLVFVAFVLYAVWELAARRVWNDARYLEVLPPGRPWDELKRQPAVREQPTIRFMIAAFVALVAIAASSIESTSVVVAIDVAGIAFVIAHRYRQDVAGARETKRAPTHPGDSPPGQS